MLHPHLGYLIRSLLCAKHVKNQWKNLKLAGWLRASRSGEPNAHFPLVVEDLLIFAIGESLEACLQSWTSGLIES